MTAPTAPTVTPRALVFVNARADVGASDPGTDTVVLDMTWTPGPDERSDVLPIRPIAQDVLDSINLFDESLERLDEWAASAGLPDRFMVDGVTWWFRIRMFVRWNLHELMLWRHVLDRIAPSGRYRSIAIPVDRGALIKAAHAGSTTVTVIRPPAPSTPAPSLAPDKTERARSTPLGRRLVRQVRRIARGVRRRVDPTYRPPPSRAALRARELRRRESVLGARAASFQGQAGGVLAVVSAGFFQVVHAGGQERNVDPHIAPVLDRLTAEGTPIAAVGLRLNQRQDDDWQVIEADEHLLPISFVRRRWRRAEDGALGHEAVAAAVAAMPDVPLLVGDADVGPALRSIVATQAGPWLGGQRRAIARAERLMLDLQPAAVLIDHEGVRTPWLAAARRCGIPIVAVQHGVIYRNNPEYCHPPHEGARRPDVTCVFGPFEREVLVNDGGYDPDHVVVTGSSRAEEHADAPTRAVDERDAVRRELGVENGDRLLVVSVAPGEVAGDIHSVTMVARMLDGPLPGVRVVIKLHPQVPADTPYEGLLAGLARAGGYAPLSVRIVKDFDLYRLLRAADAHLGLYSTVLTDSVVAGTPNMIAVGQAYGDVLGYVEARVATPVRSIDDIRAFLAAPTAADPEDRVRFLERHFRSGDATERVAAAIRGAMTNSSSADA